MAAPCQVSSCQWGLPVFLFRLRFSFFLMLSQQKRHKLETVRIERCTFCCVFEKLLFLFHQFVKACMYISVNAYWVRRIDSYSCIGFWFLLLLVLYDEPWGLVSEFMVFVVVVVVVPKQTTQCFPWTQSIAVEVLSRLHFKKKSNISISNMLTWVLFVWFKWTIIPKIKRYVVQFFPITKHGSFWPQPLTSLSMATTFLRSCGTRRV